MRLVGDIALDAEVRAIASGAITDGAPVVVNSAGTVSGISGSAASTGTAVVFATASTGAASAAFDSSSNKVVIVFTDSGNSNYGTAIVGDVSGTSISFGSEAVYESGNHFYEDVTFDSNSNRIVIAYADGSNSNYGTAVVGTVSGTSISFGTPVVFESAYPEESQITFDSNSNKVVIAYSDQGNSAHGTAIVGTVDSSDNSISFGTAVVFEAADSRNCGITFDSNSNKVVIAYRDAGNSSYGTAIVGTVSGTSISFGTPAVYGSYTSQHNRPRFNSNDNTIVISHTNNGASAGSVIVGSVSGTSIGSFGTAVNYETSTPSDPRATFDTSRNQIVIAYRDQDDSKGKFIVGTVSGNSVTLADAIIYEAGAPGTPGITFDSNSNKVVVGYADGGDSNKGKAVVFNGSDLNLTSENFIGFANAAYANGQKATVKTTGSISRNIPQIASTSDAFGDETVFESADSTWIASTFDSNSNKVVIGYRDVGNSNYGTAIVATVSGSSISYGTPVVYNSATTTENVLTFDNNNNKVVIAYNNGGDSGHGYAIVGTVSSTSISFGSAAEFENAVISDHSITFDSNVNRVVISFRDEGNSNYATAIVGAVSGTSISFGSPVVYESANPEEQAITFDSNSNKVVIAYRDHGNSQHGTAIVGTVDSSDNSISFGSAAVFNAAQTKVGGITFDSNSNKVVIVYSDIGNGQNGTAIVGTVSGTSISFGSESVFKDAQIEIESRTHTTFNSGINKVIITYMRISDDGAYYAGTVVTGTVSGTDITFATPVVFNAATSTYSTPIYDSSNNRTVITYRDVGNSNYGTAIVLVNAGTDEDLTIGQQYFVQTDGTLGTSADDPSVIAGTAIGASDLIVKG